MENGCFFEWIGNPNCNGITINATQNGNNVILSGTGNPGAFCKFRYRMFDDNGGSWLYMMGIRFYEEDSPECCIEPPCQ